LRGSGFEQDLVSGRLLAGRGARGQAEGVSRFYWSEVLVVGDEQVPVEAELGELTPAGRWEWGGSLRGMPVRLAAAMRQGEDARLRIPDGQEHGLRPAGMPRMDSQSCLAVPLLGGSGWSGYAASGVRRLPGRC
jgi:hypothetical protein